MGFLAEHGKALVAFWALSGASILAAGRLADLHSNAANPSQTVSSTERAAAPPSFARDIAPIIYQRCAFCHHAGTASGMSHGAFPLIRYEDVKLHAAEIADATRRRTMPPWLPEPGYGDFVEENRLTDKQISQIAEWIAGGVQEGPAAETPAAPVFSGDWQLGTPDIVLQADRPLSLPASGADVFWNFIFSPGLTSVRYLRAIEVHPGGDLNLIHHANVVVDPARSARRQERERGAGFAGIELALEHSPLDIPGHFLFWKPGARPWIEPDGLALRLEPGSDLVLNAHFMPAGMAEDVRPELGLFLRTWRPRDFPC